MLTTRTHTTGVARRAFWGFLGLGLALAAVSCSSTSRMEGTWVDPDHVGANLDDFLVIGISDSTEIRQAFENALVGELQKAGVRATPSIDIMPADELIEKETVLEAIQGRNIDAIIVTRLVSRDTVIAESQGGTIEVKDPYQERFYKYYNESYTVTHEPNYLGMETSVTLETNLYSAQDETLIWSSLAKSFNPRNAEDVIGPVCGEIVKKLGKDGLIGSP